MNRKFAIGTVWMMSAILSLCCGGDSDGGSDGSLGLEPPSNGIQLAMPLFEAPPQRESEFCYAFTYQGEETLLVNTFQSEYREGSHHFILYRANEHVENFPEGRMAECGQGVDEFELNTSRFHWIYGTQLESEDLRLPEGVAVSIEPGTQFIMDSHYINYGEEPITGEVRVNLVTLPESEMVHEADSYFWLNPAIFIPPQSPSATEMACALPAESSMVTLLTHTHQLGTAVKVFSELPGREPVLIHEEEDWLEPETVIFQDPYDIREGERISFRCEYDNPTDQMVTFGVSSKDEMCIISGYYYPKSENPAVRRCTR
jgi:hypothetical protein